MSTNEGQGRLTMQNLQVEQSKYFPSKLRMATFSKLNSSDKILGSRKSRGEINI